MATKASVEQRRIERQIQKLMKQSEALARKERGPVIQKIVQQMREFSITPEEIAERFSTNRSAPRSAAAGKKVGNSPKRVVPAKYRDPQTGSTWTGRGRAPNWIVDAEAAGKTRDEFLIESQDNPAPAQSTSEDTASVTEASNAPHPEQTHESF